MKCSRARSSSFREQEYANNRALRTSTMQAASSADKCALKGTTSFYDGDSGRTSTGEACAARSSRREKGRRKEEDSGASRYGAWCQSTRASPIFHNLCETGRRHVECFYYRCVCSSQSRAAWQTSFSEREFETDPRIIVFES